MTDAEIDSSRLEATLTLDVSLQPMPRNQLSFLDIKKSMSESPHYRILAHLGWLTPKPLAGAFSQYHVTGGERWLLEASSSEAINAASAVKSLLHASSRVLDGTREQISLGNRVFATRALSGRFWIVARRFFHFNAELVLTQKKNSPSADSAECGHGGRFSRIAGKPRNKHSRRALANLHAELSVSSQPPLETRRITFYRPPQARHPHPHPPHPAKPIDLPMSGPRPRAAANSS